MLYNLIIEQAPTLNNTQVLENYVTHIWRGLTDV